MRLNNREISLVFAIKAVRILSISSFPPRCLFSTAEGAERCVAGSSEAERTDVRRRNFLPYPAPPFFRSLLFLRRFVSRPLSADETLPRSPLPSLELRSNDDRPVCNAATMCSISGALPRLGFALGEIVESFLLLPLVCRESSRNRIGSLLLDRNGIVG